MCCLGNTTRIEFSFRRFGDLEAAKQAQRRELLAPRGHRHHRLVGDVAATRQIEPRELLAR